MQESIDKEITELLKQRWLKRRRFLLLVGMSIMSFVALIFIPINLMRGDTTLCLTEAWVLIVLFPLCYFVKNNRHIWLSAAIFTCIVSSWGLLTILSLKTDISAYIWIAMGPAFSFFMFGKRFSTPFSIFLVSASICVYVIPRTMAGVAIPSYSLLSYIGLTCISLVFSLYYEHIRESGELELINVIRQKLIAEHKKEKVISKLESAINEINTLRGLLPVCGKCRKIENDADSWLELEEYILKNTSSGFTHGLCPDCAKELYPEIAHELDKLYV